MPDIKFQVEMAEFKNKVNFVRNGLGPSKTDLQTQLIRIEIGGKKGVMFAANKEMFCRTEFKITRPEDGAEGSFAVLGNRLEKLIAQIETEIVTFRVDAENAEVQAGFLTVNFETYDGAPMKTIEHGVHQHLLSEGLVAPRDTLEEALICAKSCTTTNSIRPDVTHVELRGGRVLSSDGRKIMVYTHEGFDPSLNLKVPATCLDKVISAIKQAGVEKIQIIDADAYYYLKANKNEFTFGVRKVERSFPAIEEQIATTSEPSDEVSLDKHYFENMLRGVSLGLPTDEVKVTINICGTSEPWMEISALNSLGRRSVERTTVDRRSKKDIAFPISFQHLLGTLNVFKGDSVVDLLILEDKHMMMVKDRTELREVLTVIPFRTDALIEQERKDADAAAAARKAAAEKDGGEKVAGEALAKAALEESAKEDLDLE